MTLNLEAIKARCEKATAGPWQVWDGPSYVGGGRDLCIGAGENWIANVDERRCDVLDKSKAHGDEHDAPGICPICSLTEQDITTEQTATADFIAHARTDLPALVAEVERLRKVEAAAMESYSALLRVATEYRERHRGQDWLLCADETLGGIPTSSDQRCEDCKAFDALDAAQGGG